MKYYTFYRESNDFNDILIDPNIKSNTSTKIQWRNHLLIGFKHNVQDSILGLIVLKYGEDMINLSAKDYTPKPNIDYVPIKNSKQF